MRRSAIVLFTFIFLFGWHRPGPGVVLPYDHPANPYAQAAPPIEVPPIEGSDIGPVAPPELGPAGTKSAPAMQSPSPSGGAAPHEH